MTYNPHTDNRLQCKYELIKQLKERASDAEWDMDFTRADILWKGVRRLEQSNENFIANF